MTVHIDVTKLERLTTLLPEKHLKLASARAMKRTTISLRKIVNRKIAKNLKGIKKMKSKKALKLVHPRGSFSGMEGGLMIVDTSSELVNFKGRQTQKGWAGTVKKKHIIKSAFKATMKSGKTGVFLRVKGEKTKSGKTKIKMLFSTKPIEVMGDEIEKRYLSKVMEGLFFKNFKRELEYLISKY